MAYVLLVLSIGTGASLLWSIGFFDPHKVLLEVIATTGGDYGVVVGNWKLSTPAIDAVPGLSLSRHDVYVTGEPIPSDAYDLRNDYILAEGEVIGYDGHASERYPLMNVTHWARINGLDFFLRKWLAILGLVVAILLLWRRKEP
ncbi:MAG: hypothetical protein IPJ76_03280 [Flavobacteriales bacterium]|nr:MAG: hypothetical protein IPJ76_03280 [Flavobacteriales bacterium]